MKKITFACLLLVLLSSCGSLGTKTYDFPTFTFKYPAGWKSLAEISPSYKSGKEYMWLHVREDFTLTNAKAEGEPGLYLTVATKEHIDLVTFPTWTYATVEEYSQNLNQVPVTLGGVDGLMYHYDRQWAGQWYQFRDYWVTDGMLTYLLSFHAEDLGGFQEEIDLILESVTFKEWDPFAKN